MNSEKPYPIGTPGQPWGDAEKAQWLAAQQLRRSYREEVLDKLQPLAQRFDFEQYGALSCDPGRYPLFIGRAKSWEADKPVALITGGVHGYETSGVQGALRFMQSRAADFSQRFNILVAPCVSPWGYETINRWNPLAMDPNRSFRPGSGCEEAQLLMDYLQRLAGIIHVHFDLHETTDTDNSEFRPALCARDAVHQEVWDIPDGFYLVGDEPRPAPEFQRAIIAAVEQVTHIAPSDENGCIIGARVTQPGVINYTARTSGLCMGMTEATFVTTTEVYPDSPRVDDENCIQAQVAAVVGGLGYVAAQQA